MGESEQTEGTKARAESVAGDEGRHEDVNTGDDGKSPKEKDLKEDQPKKPPVYKKPAFIIAFVIFILLLIAGGIVWWLIARQYVTTDDAYVDGHVVRISPQISAPVLELHIADNQFVHKGELLVRLDPRDFEVALNQAQAQVIASSGRLAQARAQVVSASTTVPQAVAERESVKATLDNAVRDLERFEKVDEGGRSKQQLDNARTAKANATAQYESAKAKVTSAEANVKTAEAAVSAAEGELKTAEANRDKAKVNLSYCEIVAPIDGRVTERTVEPGNYVTTGQAMFQLVDPDVWITANFKETQLTRLQPGQPATIKVDAFPDRKFNGRVESIQAGSGARFSVLPAENATGNYVKIVQRVPVKIVFEHDANTNNASMLSPGLSVIPRVKVR